MIKSDLYGALARGYCSEKNSSKILDPDLIEAMAKEVIFAWSGDLSRECWREKMSKYICGFIIGIMFFIVIISVGNCAFGGRDLRIGNVARYENKIAELNGRLDGQRELIGYYFNLLYDKSEKQQGEIDLLDSINTNILKTLANHKHKFLTGEVVR